MGFEITFLSVETVVILHHRLIERYGGSFGVRDAGLLASALAQPQAGFGGNYVHAYPFEMAASYLFHITKNHPFIDGNKRIAFASADVFLSLHGFTIVCSEDEAADYVLAISAGSPLSKLEITQQLEQWCL